MRSIQEQMHDRKSSGLEFSVDALGTFQLRRAHGSWTDALMLGALDYFKTSNGGALQIVPDMAHWTVDIPDMGRPWSAAEAPIWRWLHEAWPYSAPQNSTVTTNLDALRGRRITEVVRWGDDEWEMFAGAGPDVRPADVRVVPLGTLLAADPSLAPSVDLQIGKGLWRDESDGGWSAWGKTDQASEDG